jgi:hypothetical protein
MPEETERVFNPSEFVPSLRERWEKSGLSLNEFHLLALPVKAPKDRPLAPAGPDRSRLCILDGDRRVEWHAESLQKLFRGDKQPPLLGDYPDAFLDSFALLELHVLQFSNSFGDRRDAEMLEIYSALRRRPDGRSLGDAHDYMWQAAAYLLGTRILSRAEFEAIMSRLERSCRTFRLHSTSHNYVDSLRMVG